jgi:phosphoenolpyruvate carboxylase
MTGRVYCLGYLGFGLPTAIAWLHSSYAIGTPATLLGVASAAVAANVAGAAILRILSRTRASRR